MRSCSTMTAAIAMTAGLSAVMTLAVTGEVDSSAE